MYKHRLTLFDRKCIEELRDKAEFFEKHDFVPIFDTEYNAAKSDTLVPESLRQELDAQCQRLMNVPHSARDYHPNSNDQVLNLVHPSLYPLMYGKSRIFTPGPVPLTDCSTYIGKGEILPPQEPAGQHPPGEDPFPLVLVDVHLRIRLVAFVSAFFS